MSASDSGDEWVKVDAWMVPAADAEAYRRAREEFAGAAAAYAESHGLVVERAGLDSEDGEYIATLDQDGRTLALVHLDPDTVDAFARASQQGTREKFLGEALG